MQSALIEFGIDKRKISYIPSFLNLDLYKSHFSNEGYVLYFGRITHEKGVQELIKAWSILGDNPPQLFIIGSGEYAEDVIRLTKELNVYNVKFLNFVKDQKQLISYIQKSAFTIIPSLCYDNSPMAAYESMACGKPVIASDIGGLKDQIEDGVNGYLVPPGCPDKLASAILKLWSSPSDLQKFGKCSREKMETIFSADNHFSMLEKQFGIIRVPN